MAVGLLAACTPAPSSSQFGDADLPTVSAAPRATATSTPPADFSDLDRLVDASGSTCTLVMRGGQVVHEQPAGSRHATRRVYSITKSVVAMLVAIAAQEGRLTLDDPVGDHLDRWPAASRGVTVRHLLTMTSGRQWSASLDAAMIDAADQTAAAVKVGQQDRPGTVWRYDNLAAQVLSPVLESAVGDVEAFARARLFEPLGLRDTTWERDGAGNLKTYAGIVSSCADLARIGVVMRDAGRYGGRQIVPADGVRALTTPSTALNAAYGQLWWTNAAGTVVEVRRAAGFDQDRDPYRGRLAPGAPADAFWAYGWGAEYLAVVPSTATVAVRLGPKPAGAEYLTFDDFTSALGGP